jgi:hypothetical protein
VKITPIEPKPLIRVLEDSPFKPGAIAHDGALMPYAITVAMLNKFNRGWVPYSMSVLLAEDSLNPHDRIAIVMAVAGIMI